MSPSKIFFPSLDTLSMKSSNLSLHSILESGGLYTNRPVGAQVGHAGPVINRIGLSFNMEEERIV